MTREGLETCREALDPGEAEDNQTPLVRPAAWLQLLGLLTLIRQHETADGFPTLRNRCSSTGFDRVQIGVP